MMITVLCLCTSVFLARLIIVSSTRYPSITCTNDLSKDDYCEIDCTIDPLQCQYNTLSCEEGYDCIVNCSSNHACYSSIINCPTNNDCAVDCSSDWACIESTTYCPNNGDCIVDCSESYGCPYGCIECPKNNGDCYVNCDGYLSCSVMSIICYMGYNDLPTCDEQDIVYGSGTTGLTITQITQNNTDYNYYTTTTTTTTDTLHTENNNNDDTQNDDTTTKTTTITTPTPVVDINIGDDSDESNESDELNESNEVSDSNENNDSSDNNDNEEENMMDFDADGVESSSNHNNSNTSNNSHKSKAWAVVIFVLVVVVTAIILAATSSFVACRLYSYYRVKTGKNPPNRMESNLCSYYYCCYCCYCCCGGDYNNRKGSNDSKPDILRMHSIDRTPTNRSFFYMERLRSIGRGNNEVSISDNDLIINDNQQQGNLLKLPVDNCNDEDMDDNSNLSNQNDGQTVQTSGQSGQDYATPIKNGINKIGGMVSGMMNGVMEYQYNRVNTLNNDEPKHENKINSNVNKNNGNKFNIFGFMVGNKASPNKEGGGEEGEQDDESSFSDTDPDDVDGNDNDNDNNNDDDAPDSPTVRDILSSDLSEVIVRLNTNADDQDHEPDEPSQQDKQDKKNENKEKSAEDKNSKIRNNRLSIGQSEGVARPTHLLDVNEWSESDSNYHNDYHTDYHTDSNYEHAAFVAPRAIL